jgi:hypothetical protein
MSTSRHALIALCALTCACLPNVVAPTGQDDDAGGADASTDTRIDPPDVASEDADDPDPPDMAPEDAGEDMGTPPVCEQNQCAIYEFCTDDGCVIPSTGAPSGVPDGAGLDFGWALAHDTDTLFVGLPSERTVYTVRTGASGAMDTPAPLLIDTQMAEPTGGRHGAAIDAYETYAIVGAPGERPDVGTNGPISGAIRLYKRAGETWSPVNAWDGTRNRTADPGRPFDDPPTGLESSALDGFATSVSIQWPFFAAGAPNYNPNAFDAPPGRVALWYAGAGGGSSNPVLIDGLHSEKWYQDDTDPAASAAYGTAVLIRRNHLFVGAPGLENTAGEECGGVFVYKLAVAGADRPRAVEIAGSPFLAPQCDGDGAGSRFGSSLVYRPEPDAGGATLFVGAPGHDNGLGAVVAVPVATDQITLGLDLAGAQVITPRVNDPVSGFGSRFAVGADNNYLFVGVPGASLELDAGFPNGLVISFVRVQGAGREPDWAQVDVWEPDLGSRPFQSSRVGEALVGAGGTVYVSAPGAPGRDGAPRGRVFAMEASRIDAAANPD